MNKSYWVLITFLLPVFAFAQSDGDYQSRATGPWFTETTWQVYFNGDFRNLEDASAGPYRHQIPNNPPSLGQPVGEINIIGPNTVTINAAVTLSSNPLYVSPGATLIISNTPSATDITVDVNSSVFIEGILALANGATHSGFNNSTTTVLAGGVYEHQYTTTRGVIIGAQWDDESTIRFTSYTNPGNFTGAENLDQDYFNFEWNCPQSGNIELNGNLHSVRNDLSILSTDTGTPSVERLRIFGDSNDNTLTVGHDLIISGTSSVAFTTNGTGNVVEVTGDVLSSATIRTTFVFGTGSLDLNVGGDYTQSGTTHRFTTNAAAIFNLNLTGDFSHATSAISATVASVANLNFGSNSTQTYTGTGTITGPINYFVEGTTLLDMGTSSLRGAGTFTLRAGATLLAGAFSGSGTNTSGAIQTGTAQGNLRVSGVRTFEDESTIVYNGAAAQQLGSGHPAAATIVNTIIQNGLGVTTVGSRTISGDLTLQSGNLAIAGATALTLNRNISPNGNFITPNTTSDLVINGDGLTGTFPFPAGTITIRNFTLNRSGGSLTFGNNVTITGAVALTNGELNFSGRTLILNGTFSSAGGSLFSNSTASVLQIGGTGAFGSLLMATEPNNQVGTFTFARTTTGTLTNAGDLHVVTTFNLNNGTFTNSGSLTFANGATLNRILAAATIAGNRPSTNLGDAYNVSYTGTMTTGLELPDPTNDTDLGNLTIVSGTVTLAQDLTINGIVNLNGGAFALGANTITMEGSGWNDNAGNFTVGTGIVVFNSTTGTTIGGSSIPQLGNMTLNNGASLTFPSGTLSISGDIQMGSSSTLNANSGILNLNGATSTNFAGGGKTYSNIILAKTASSDVTLSSGVNLTGQLTIIANGCDFGSNGHLTLISNASGTARIGVLTATRTVSGNVVAQRYIAAKGRFYRDISSPVLNPSVQQLTLSGITITGNFTGSSFPCGGCATNNPSMYFYDETLAGLQSVGYTAFPPSGGNSTTSFLARGRGYNVLIRNELGSPTASVTGVVNSGTIPLPVSYTTTTGGTNEDGWNFVGNPYPSAIDWDNAGWTKTNVTGNQISVYDPAKPPSGGYRVWNGTVGDLGNGRIASGQGFWFKASAAPVLQLTEATKTITSTTFYRQRAPDDVHYIQLALLGNGVEENAYIQKVDGAKKGYDEFDGFKLPFQEDVALSTLSDDGVNSLSINAIGEVIEQGEIQIQIKNLTSGAYTFTVKVVGDFSGSVIKIRDNYLHTTKELEGSTFKFSVSDASGSKSADRFTLVFGGETSSSSKGHLASLYPNPVTDVVNVEVFSKETPYGEVMDLTGKVVGNLTWEKLNENSWKGALNMNTAQTGMYIARVKVGPSLETIKFIKK